MVEYQAVLNSSTLNLLKFSHPWTSAELSSLPYLLMEAGVVKSKDRKGVHTETWDYLNYLVPTVLRCIYEIHEDHVNPKGLMTKVGSLIESKEDESDNHTLCDKDNYMSEILNEEDDLYA